MVGNFGVRKVINQIVMVLLLGTASWSEAATLAFNSASDLAQFSLNGAASTGFIYSTTAGVGGGGGLTSTTTDFSGALAVYATGSANTLGDTKNVSLDYKIQLQSVAPDIRVGFTSELAGSFNGANDIWVETFGGTTTKVIGYASGLSGESISSATVVAGNWYRLSLDLTKTSTSAYSGEVKFYSLGNDGLAAPSLLSSQTFTFSSIALGGAASLFPSFYLYPATTGADNFSVTSAVPEPSVPSLLMGAGVYALALRRRRPRRI